MKIERPFHERQHALDEIYERHGLRRRVQPEVTLKGIAKFVGAVLLLALGMYALAFIRGIL